ncbi:MAG: hypothetical protein ACYS83_10565 [Planctomycetota bacterium]
MSKIDEKEIIKRFETISEFKLSPEITARADRGQGKKTYGE